MVGILYCDICEEAWQTLPDLEDGIAHRLCPPCLDEHEHSDEYGTGVCDNCEMKLM